ncbi:hypothetical protein [Oceanidesulfovibrio indonesiensis]|nr:hypothetical protein [Oceanidesulfovibrio indonesiensis]
MKRPTDLLFFDWQDEHTEQPGFSGKMQPGEPPAHAGHGSACRPGGALEHGRAMAGLAASLKERNKRARQTGGAREQKARAKSRTTLSKALGRIFDAQADPGQDEVVVVSRPAKKGGDDR